MIAGIFTIAAITGFGGVAWWAYTRRNRERFVEASMLPLDDEAPLPLAQNERLPPCCRSPQS